MSQAPDPGLAPARPKDEITVAVLASVKDLLPSVALSIALGLMVFVAVPAANHDPVLSIISGMLGFLTGRATSPKPPVQ